MTEIPPHLLELARKLDEALRHARAAQDEPPLENPKQDNPALIPPPIPSCRIKPVTAEAAPGG